MDDHRHAFLRRIDDLREILQHAETNFPEDARALSIVKRHIDDAELWLEEVLFEDDDGYTCTRCHHALRGAREGKPRS